MKNMTLIKGELEKYGLPKTLEERLIQAIHDNLPVASGIKERDDCLKGMYVLAYWEVQVPNPARFPSQSM